MLNKQALLEIIRRHPRKGSLLPVTEEKRQEILTKEVYKDYLAEIRAEGERLHSTPIVSIPYNVFKLFDVTGDRVLYQKYYFEMRGRLATMGLLAWLYEKEDDIHALEDAIWAVCDEYTWSLPAHIPNSLVRLENDGYTVDLFASETACTLCEVIALNEDKLAPIVKDRAHRLVKERVFEGLLQRPFHWETGGGNWSAVCAGSIGVAALYAADDDMLAALLERLESAIEVYFASFPADGTSLEGISYWTYGYSFFTAYAEMLCRCTGGELDWFKDPRAEKVALFQQKAYFKGGNMISFADCGPADTARWWGLTAFLKTRYSKIESLPRPYFMGYTADECYRWAGILRDLAWSDESLPENYTPKNCYLQPDAQWLIANSENVGMVAKGGHNAEPHNHNDVGNFQLFKGGDEMLLDFGCGLYSKTYFHPDYRYKIFTCGSQGHNVPIVEGLYQQCGKEYCAKDVKLGEWFIEMDIAPAYDDKNLLSLIRRISFDKETGRTTLTDTFTFKETPSAVVERFVTRCKIDTAAEKVTLTGPHAAAEIAYDNALFETSTHTETADDHVGSGSSVLHVLDFTFRAPEKVCTCTFAIE